MRLYVTLLIFVGTASPCCRFAAVRPAAVKAATLMNPHPVPPFGAYGNGPWLVLSNTVRLESGFHVTRKSAGYQAVCAYEYVRNRSLMLASRKSCGAQIFETLGSAPALCAESGADTMVGSGGSVFPVNQRECAR